MVEGRAVQNEQLECLIRHNISRTYVASSEWSNGVESSIITDLQCSVILHLSRQYKSYTVQYH